MDRVTVTREGAVAHVQLSRPEKRNGLDEAMFRALVDTGEALKGDRAVRAVVLSGAGRAFCAGLDFQSFLAMGADGANALLERPEGRVANLAQHACWVWREVPVPVIAALHGAVYGGGLQLALAADLRIAHPEAELSVMEIRYGLIPDMTASQTLFRLVREDLARELVYTGRVVRGEEAVRLGLATRLHDQPLEEALRLARDLASRSPHAIRAAKVLAGRAFELGVTEALKLETELQLPLLGSPNQLEAVAAVFSKRDPEFQDP